MSNLTKEQLIEAFLTSVPTNPVHRELVDSDYEDTEYLEDTPFDYREDYMSAVESGVWI
jgi:hypothetical protein